MFQRLSVVLLTLLISQFSPTHGATISSNPAQTFKGIGGSGAWWPYDIYKFPESVRSNLADLLFSDSGLGLSSYRWNIGAGGVNVNNPTRAPETFWAGYGSYNWSADPQGRYFVKAASDRGVQDIAAFANSAPPSLNSGGASCGGSFVKGNGYWFGRYLADIIAHFRDEGIKINLVSPMNEPDSDFGPAPCGQEGMRVYPEDRAEVINGVYDALSSLGLQNNVGIIVDESSSLGRATSGYGSWLPQVKNRVAALVHHTYDFPSDSSYLNYVNTVKSQYPGLETWMSEICCSLGQADGTGRGWSGGYDPSITNALMFSGLVFQSFNVAQETHYDFWTLVSGVLGCSPSSDPSCPYRSNSDGWNDGLIYYDPDYASTRNYDLYIKKQFWTYKHFGNFIKPGSQRLPISGSDADNRMIAVRSADQRTYYVIAMNPYSSAKTVRFNFPTNVSPSAGYRTSAGEDWATLNPGSVTREGNDWVVRLEGMSLTSWVWN